MSDIGQNEQVQVEILSSMSRYSERDIEQNEYVDTERYIEQVQ